MVLLRRLDGLVRLLKLIQGENKTDLLRWSPEGAGVEASEVVLFLRDDISEDMLELDVGEIYQGRRQGGSEEALFEL